MSTENIQALFEKAATDAALQQKLEALKDAPLDDLLNLASEQGLPFTAEDWQAYLDKSGDLSDAELSSVSGGSGDSLDAWERTRKALRQRQSDKLTLNLGPEK